MEKTPIISQEAIEQAETVILEYFDGMSMIPKNKVKTMLKKYKQIFKETAVLGMAAYIQSHGTYVDVSHDLHLIYDSMPKTCSPRTRRYHDQFKRG